MIGRLLIQTLHYTRKHFFLIPLMTSIYFEFTITFQEASGNVGKSVSDAVK